MTTLDHLSTQHPRWDIVVRITHWGIALAIVLNGLITEEGSGWHIWVGYGALALLVLRLAWGFLGTTSARFSNFAPSLSRALTHARLLKGREDPPYPSHNPLGALMAFALWFCLAGVTATGVAMAGSPLDTLPGTNHEEPHDAVASQSRTAADRHDDDEHDEEDEGEEWLEEIHETFANLLFLLAGLHVAGVVLESRRTGRDHVTPMLTGRPQQSSE